MSGTIAWLTLALGLGLVVVRRRSSAIALVTLQSLLIGIGALSVTRERSTEYHAAGIALLAKAVLIGAILGWTLHRTREQRPITENMPALVRFAAAVTLAIGAAVLIPSFGLVARSSEQVSLALVAVGLSIVATRKATLLQALGLLVAENGLAVAATAVVGGLPLVIELGVVFDLIVIIVVATAFHERIFQAFGTADTSLLRGLRD